MRSARARLLLPVLALSVLSNHARAEDADDPLAGLSGARALEIAKELAADEMKGRKTGFEGGLLVEEYVASAFTNIGMSPMDADGDYLDGYSFGATEVVPPIALAVDGQTVEYGSGYVDLLYTGQGVVEGEVVFVGYGICAPDRRWDDYADLDVKGKVVLAIRGAPAAREAEFTVERQIGYKTSLARDRGAVACLLVEGKTPVPGTIQEKFHRHDLPALWVSSDVADLILAKHARRVEDLKASRDGGEPGRSFATGAKVRVEVHGRFNPQAKGRNAIAGFPGSDPDLRHEVILVGAHMDHIGVDPLGRVFNGADDNASGTSTLLMLAETLTKNGWRPKRTVVFCAFGGEEQGLVGSKWMASHSPLHPKTIVAMFNMDMTGQGKPEVNLGGGEGYPSMWKRVLGFVPPASRDTVKPFRVQENSDHWPFFERGIPSFFAVTAGDHPNYHQVGDDAQNLKPECMEAAARVVGSIVVGLADVPEPFATGASLPELLLHESPRVVEGPDSAKALAAYLAGPKDGDRSALSEGGFAVVTMPVPESGAGPLVEWARLTRSVRAHAPNAQVVSSASDLVNAARAGRAALLPRASCAASARAYPGVLFAYAALGIRWVAPFQDGQALPDAERDAILDAAVAAKVLVDLTGLPATALPAARARLADAPATYRIAPSLGGDAVKAADVVRTLRATLGPKTLLVVGGDAAAPLLDAASIGAQEDPALAPVAIVSDDTPALARALAAACKATPDLEAPNSSQRARVRSLLGGAWVDLLRRLP